MKYRYHKQYVREDYLLTKSPIFDLSKSHSIKKQKDMKQEDYGFDDNNILAFQAGGPNVKNPFVNVVNTSLTIKPSNITNVKIPS
jgi:hypothetical protein